MLFILHVVMKTLDKTCCHVYIYIKCLHDNITTLGRIMDKEQALLKIDFLISEAKDREDRHEVVGYINACFDFGLIDGLERTNLFIKAMGLVL